MPGTGNRALSASPGIQLDFVADTGIPMERSNGELCGLRVNLHVIVCFGALLLFLLQDLGSSRRADISVIFIALLNFVTFLF